jgi:hypothetical protein
VIPYVAGSQDRHFGRCGVQINGIVIVSVVVVIIIVRINLRELEQV